MRTFMPEQVQAKRNNVQTTHIFTYLRKKRIKTNPNTAHNTQHPTKQNKNNVFKLIKFLNPIAIWLFSIILYLT